MDRSPVVLINANEMRPPVAPIALDYIGAALQGAGFAVHLVDLTFAGDAAAAIAEGLGEGDPLAVGITCRNTEDCYWPSSAWFVPRLAEVVDMVRRQSEAPVILGGCGFSLFPAQIMDHCGVDLGVVGDGEAALVELAGRLREDRDYRGVPGLAWRDGSGRVVVNDPVYGTVLSVPATRSVIDNARYLREGGMGGIETKRGCPGQCIYCADPLGKGGRSRCRAPGEVADEITALLDHGVDVYHLCDSEFNLPPDHARAVCEEIIRRGLGERISWYCYAAVSPFSDELAGLMRRAGCVGINFGADSGVDRMLMALGRGYGSRAIRDTVRSCRQAGITVMLDLLLGAPGEDEESVRASIEFVKAVDPDRAGAAVGVRVYPGTRLAKIVLQQGPLDRNPSLRGCREGNDDLFRPVFYVEHGLGSDPGALVADAIAGDERFFQPAAGNEELDYNYNQNEVLQRAIKAGERGAFWDILRRIR